MQHKLSAKKRIRLVRQQGAALILFFIAVLMTATLYFVSSLSVVTSHNKSEDVTSNALSQAKEALLSYAVSYYENANNGRFGFLPCPETSTSPGSEGNEMGNCAPQYEHALGRLPWKTMGIEPLRDGTGECLWYALSGVYKNGSATEAEMHNEDSVGMFELYDENGNALKAGAAANRVVAVVIAPGAKLTGQNRQPPDLANAPFCKVRDDQAQATEYLEIIGVHDNAVFDDLVNVDTFVTARNQQNSNINDRIITLSQAEIFSAVRKSQKFQQRMHRLTESIAQCVNEYIVTNVPVTGGGWCDLATCLNQCAIDQTNCYNACPTQAACRSACNDAARICRDANILPNSVCNQIARDCRSACPTQAACFAACDTVFTTCEANCNATCTPGGGGGGGNNFWLPWPAPVNLSANIDDYRQNVFYDDANANQIPGRLPQTIDDSSTVSTNPAVDMFANCSAITPTINPFVPAVSIDFTDDANDEYKILWRHWKDHIFYVIGSGFEVSNAPATATPDCTATPTSCVEVIDGAGVSSYYAAIVIYSGSAAAGQSRDLDKGDYTHYLESYDVANNRFSFTSGQDSDDIAYCISDQRVISKCSP